MPLAEDFYDFYFDTEVDLIVMDEFKGNKTIQSLNQWLDGSMMTVRVKGSQRIKNVNQPFIILSNYSVEESYSGVTGARVDALKSRLVEYYLDEPLDLDNVQWDSSQKLNEKEEEEDLSQIL